MKWEEIEEKMTLEQAQFVREKKLDKWCSWRAIAGICHDEWNGDWECNQLAGMDICKKAASFFNEDYMQEPWN